MSEKNKALVKINLFQLHYYLKENSHSMNALTLNKIEGEFLKIVDEISRTFNCKVIVESKAIEEGGIKSIYALLTNESNIKYTLSIGVFIITTLTNILTNVVSNKLSEDKKQSALTKKKNILEIEKLTQEIILNSIEIAEKTGSNQKEINIEVDEDRLKEQIEKVIVSNKIKKYKSNIYKNLLKENKVNKFSSQILSTQRKPISEERIVLRQNFKNYIYNEEKLEPRYLNGIELEIISPVLNEKKMTWRALFNDENITFKVKDDNFQNLIINKGLSFNNGTILLCDMEIKLKQDSNGDIKETSKTVYDVTQIKYPNGDVVDVL